jgi:hypothetical protein
VRDAKIGIRTRERPDLTRELAVRHRAITVEKRDDVGIRLAGRR